jgi:hypothetical protein
LPPPPRRRQSPPTPFSPLDSLIASRHFSRHGSDTDSHRQSPLSTPQVFYGDLRRRRVELADVAEAAASRHYAARSAF